MCMVFESEASEEMQMSQALVTIYRVEDAWGIGALSSSGLTDRMNAAMTGSADTDWHDQEALPASTIAFGVQPRNMVCGVDNARDLVSWFPRGMRRVIAGSEYGLTRYVMPADAILTSPGAKQIMFDPNLAVSSEHLPFGGAPAKGMDWLDS